MLLSDRMDSACENVREVNDLHDIDTVLKTSQLGVPLVYRMCCPLVDTTRLTLPGGEEEPMGGPTEGPYPAVL